MRIKNILNTVVQLVHLTHLFVVDVCHASLSCCLKRDGGEGRLLRELVAALGAEGRIGGVLGAALGAEDDVGIGVGILVLVILDDHRGLGLGCGNGLGGLLLLGVLAHAAARGNEDAGSVQP